MRFGKSFQKEVYIHLVENEQAFVAAIRYGVTVKSTRFPLALKKEVPSNAEDESLPVLTTRRHFSAEPPRGH